MLPFSAAIVTAMEQFSIKFSLTRLKIDAGRFNVQAFPLLFLFALILVPLDPRVNYAAFSHSLPVLEMVLLLAIGAMWHFAYFKAVKFEHVEEVELFRQLRPIAAAALAALLFTSERNLTVTVAIGISTLVLLWSHLDRRGFHWSKMTPYLTVGVLGIAAEFVLVKELIVWMSPIVLVCGYSGILALVFHRFIADRVSEPQQIVFLVLSSLLSTGSALLIFYSIGLLGVGRTTTALLIEPVLIYAAAKFFLGEKLHPKKVIAGLTVVALSIWVGIVG